MILLNFPVNLFFIIFFGGVFLLTFLYIYIKICHLHIIKITKTKKMFVKDIEIFLKNKKKTTICLRTLQKPL